MDEKETKSKISILTKITIALVLVLAVILVQIFLLPALGFGQERYMRMENTGVGFFYDFNANAAFHSNDSRFFFHAERNGIRVMSSNDVISWNYNFSFTRPVISARGDYIAVGEQDRGQLIYVFHKDGPSFLYRVEFDNPVLSFSVNASGFLTAIVQYGASGYGVYVFNQLFSSMQNRAFYRTFRGELQHPVLADVSECGTYIAIARVDLTARVDTVIEFRYLNLRDARDTARGPERGLFASDTFRDELVTAMRFMNGNRLIVATTSRITCFQVGPGHAERSEQWSIELQNTISHIEFYNGTHFAYATGDRLVGASDGDPLGTVRIVNVNGIQSGIFNLGRRVTHLRSGHGSILVGADRNFHAIDLRGELLWEHIIPYEVRDVLFLDDTSTILIARSGGADVYRRRRVREAELEASLYGNG